MMILPDLGSDKLSSDTHMLMAVETTVRPEGARKPQRVKQMTETERESEKYYV